LRAAPAIPFDADGFQRRRFGMVLSSASVSAVTLQCHLDGAKQLDGVGRDRFVAIATIASHGG
jgi:hypothetical protein